MPGMVPAYGPAACPPEGFEPSWSSRFDDLGQRLAGIFMDPLHGHYFRTEFLLYDIEPVGTVLLGAPLTSVRDPSQPFNIFVGLTQIGTGAVPTTSEVNFDDLYGTRLTWGIPLANDVTLEVSGFATQEGSEEHIYIPNPAGQLVVNSVLADGAVSDNLQIYNTAYSFTYSSRVMGAGAKFVFPGKDIGCLALRPTWGWRYFQFQESFAQQGRFTNGTFGQVGFTDQFSFVRSDVYNNIMGMEFGAQMETRWWILALGAEPSITLGPNVMQARTTTSGFVSTTDPLRIVEIDETGFSPVLEVSVYAAARIRQNVELRAGYDVLWMFRTQRAADGIVWDTDTATATSLVRPEENLSAVFVDGINVSLTVFLGHDSSSERNHRNEVCGPRW